MRQLLGIGYAHFNEVKDGKVITIDGKRVRESYGNRKSAIHMASAFSAESGLVLEQVKTEDKSNEITVISELLGSLLSKGSIIMLDAMGCQRKIAEEISKQGGYYVLAVKENQGKLHGALVNLFEQSQLRNFNAIWHRQHETVDAGMGV